jgi:hypothetical protein
LRKSTWMGKQGVHSATTKMSVPEEIETDAVQAKTTHVTVNNFRFISSNWMFIIKIWGAPEKQPGPLVILVVCDKSKDLGNPQCWERPRSSVS